jgi:5-methylcytosine-specific restriction endonuclease McrA
VRKGKFNSGDFDNVIRFFGQAGDHLIRLAPLIRPLVQREWTSQVARFNQLPEAELDQFLFGTRREAIAQLREPLVELQDGRCFYCCARLRGRTEVDHFVPWSRHPDDGLDNLVAAHGACNGRKRDHLASADHVDHWVSRLCKKTGDLAEIAGAVRWGRQPERTLGVASAIYLRLPPDARLWQRGERFVPVDVDRLRRAFETAFRCLSEPASP